MFVKTMNSDPDSVQHQTPDPEAPQIPVVKVEGLTVYHGSYAAVQDVSFDLFAGTDTAIVGPNGSGKSTLVQALLGLIPYATGKITLFGQPMERLGRLRQRIGYVPQNFVFDRSFPLSVSELVGLGWVGSDFWWFQPRKLAALRHQRSRAIAQALERVDAYHLRRQPIGTLSTGELKRILLAYCLVMPRQLLVLDEAFAGVDVQGEADFYTLLNELKQEQQWTILQVSHDLEMVSRHCDRVLCLNRNLICYGRPDVALSTQNLLAAYGPAFSHYQHSHD
jgi:zinc transport system ATP-binding protein